jgi:hypothetical protein
MALLTHCVSLFVGYWLASICEWVLHKWVMHATRTKNIPTQIFKKIHKEHLIHHIESNYDMTQKAMDRDVYKESNVDSWSVDEVVSWLSKKNSAFKQYSNIFIENEIHGADLRRIEDEDLQQFGIKRYFDRVDILEQIEELVASAQDKKNQIELFAGLYFEWSVTLTLCVSFFFASIFVNTICLGVLPYFDVIVYGQMFAVYITICWNYIHPTQHLQPALSLKNGLDIVPRCSWIENTFIYGWLWENHVFHHLTKGREMCNYNVTLPGADWLFGTYKTFCKGYIVDVQNKKIWKFAHTKFAPPKKEKDADYHFLYKVCFFYFLLIVIPFSIFLVYKVIIPNSIYK